mmetsp:Transcript_12151/g.34175  ORF Transcript_12151/g.34175 Transcript_12151/m.34175 type:complete len:219 (-) Transcript_12151:64-720(-)
MVALHVHPDVDPSAPRKGSNENSAILAMELGDSEEGQGLLGSRIQGLLIHAGLRRVVVRDALLLVLHCEVHMRVHVLRAIAAPGHEVHDDWPDLRLLLHVPQPKGPPLEREGDGAVAGVIYVSLDVLGRVVEGNISAELHHDGAVVEGGSAEGQNRWLWVLDHHRNVSGHRASREQQEEFRPRRRLPTECQHEEQHVVQGRRLLMWRPQLHLCERVTH